MASVGVTGASAATAPQLQQAVRPLPGAEKARGDTGRPPSDETARGQGEDSLRTEVSLDPDAGQRVFKRVVATTGHVLWQAPDEKQLERARAQKQLLGVFADKTV